MSLGSTSRLQFLQRRLVEILTTNAWFADQTRDLQNPTMTRTNTSSFDIARILTETNVRHVEYHARLASTNATALELLGPLLEDSPSLVLTGEQTSGRGRTGNLWWSSAGALTISMVVDASEIPLTAERRPMVSLAAGLAVRDALSGFLPEHEFVLKWPNDVLTGSQKICGILVEQHSIDQRQGVIIGIGVNVNNSLRGAPTDVAQRATSLFDLEGRSFDLTSVLIAILRKLDHRIGQLSTQPRLALSEANRHNVLTGRTVTLKLGETELSGHCVGIDEEGHLVLQTDHGIRRCSSGIVLRW